MKITDNSKISEIIKSNSDSIDAIANVATPLKRLKNPILRKLMANRVTIAEAAKMGGCKVEDIVKALIPLGFQYEYETPIEETKSTINVEDTKKPEWILNANDGQIVELDVRPIIEKGTDPLKEILRAYKNLELGKILNVINSFVPTPLIHLLKQEQGVESFVDEISSQEFHTYFLKREKQKDVFAKSENEKVIMDDEISFSNVKNNFSEDKIKTIDVRHLPMPQPMETILSNLNELPEGNALYVHHKRVPVYLLEELADKNYKIHIHSIEDGNVKMLIFKSNE